MTRRLAVKPGDGSESEFYHYLYDSDSLSLFFIDYIPDQASGLLHFLTSGLKHCRISWGGSISLQCPVGGRGGKFRPASPQLVFIITVDRGGGGRCAEPGKSRAQSGILFMHIVEYYSRLCT